MQMVMFMVWRGANNLMRDGRGRLISEAIAKKGLDMKLDRLLAWLRRCAYHG
jgi:hypothetical protein